MRTPIAELTDGQSVDQPFRVGDKQLRVNRDGGKYMMLKLSDRTGTLTAMVWNADQKLFDTFDRGDYLNLLGRTQIHKGNLQVIGKQIRRLSPEDVDASDFDRHDPAASAAALGQLREMLSELRNVHLRSLAAAYLDDDDFVESLGTAAAAVSNHHAYPGGLLRHTVDLMQLADFVGNRYDGIDTELLIVGAFLHDLGKIHELAADGEIAYTDRGQLVGHIVIGLQMLDDKIRHLDDFPESLRLQLEHLIVSHHGLLEYGSPRVPHTLEAVALHHIDNLDAKLTSYTSIIETDVSGDPHWTNYQPSIGRKLFKPTPEN